MTSEEAFKIIQDRCPRCEYGYIKHGITIICTWWECPGHVGGFGTEDKARCSHFKDTGKIRKIK